MVVLVSDAAFLVANYLAGRQSLERTMVQEGEKLRSGFEVAMSMTYANMLQLATFISTDPDVRETFAAGGKAVQAEGGGPGGKEAARHRQRLLAQVEERWLHMQRQFGVRQLHFHLAPGSLSFLRVHAVEKYGDRMDELRHIVVDANADREAKVGLETGRVYTGLRGVAPVIGPDGGHVGAVEVGSSFGPVVKTLDKSLDAGIAIMLRREHVDSAMWDEFIRAHLPEHVQNCGCFVEASSRDEIFALLRDPGFRRYQDQTATFAVAVGDRMMGVTRFPLRDYLGMRDPSRPPVGSVVLWTDDTAAFAAFREAQLFNLAYGLFGFVLVEALLWAALRLGQRHMQNELAARTAEVGSLSARNRAMLEAAADGVCGLDAKGRTTFANPAALAMLGWSEEDFLARDQHSMIHHSHADGTAYAGADCPVAATLADGQVRHVTGEVFWRRDGASFPVDYVVAPLLATDGTIEGAVVQFRDDTQRRRAETELADKSAALEKSNGELERFASVVSHDLQSPLRMVVAYLGLIESHLGDKLDAETREYLTFAVDGGRRASAMIRDLLAYSRVGRNAPLDEDVDMGAVAATVLRDLSPLVQEAGAEIRLAQSLPSLRGNRGELSRLLQNLLANAIKYRSPDRRLEVEVSARREDGSWRFAVADNGIGVPEEYRERIFDFFQRAGQLPEVDGTGIGLAVCKKIVEMHRGRLWVEPRPDGPGSVFCFTLRA